jgi:hypothetical protein
LIREWAQHVGNPGGGVAKVPTKGGTIVVGDLPEEYGTDFVVDLILLEIAKGLDQRAALAAGGGQVSRHGPLEDDLLFPEFHLAGGSIGKKDDPGRHLLGKAEYIGGVCSRGLETDCIASHQRAGDGIGGRGNRTEHGMFYRVVIEAPSQQPDDSLIPKPAKGRLERLALADDYGLRQRLKQV